ncbi:MAG: UDP-N-acetylmuramoyl-L-alanine--D-glutamate ligase [Acidobacteria bacterium]|nr:UDP-N-acetylmuramoyl-L-alanine--D-glutamate ligase [Acidobacteriota bacterium]
MSEFTVRHQRVVVVGGAGSGIAAARLLADRGARVTLTDKRTAIDGQPALESLGVALVLGDHPAELLSGADLVVVSPGVPFDEPSVAAARAAGVPVIGEIELASRWLRGRIVAITGTKGKSTTSALTGRMLAEAGMHAPVGGNIGTPLSAHVADSRPETIHVVEVSSFQLETAERFHPWVAALLNLTPDHLDRHATVEEYAAAKSRIFARQTPDDRAVVNADDVRTIEMASRGRAPLVRFARDAHVEAGTTIADGWIVERGPSGDLPIVRVRDVRLIGPHLLADVLAASAIARLAGVEPAAIARAVASFTGLEHAMEWVDEIGGVRFVNDSKATNVDAARQAIETFGDGLVVIMGGRYKGGDLAVLRGPLAARRATVVTIGESAPLFREALAGAVEVSAARSMAEAVQRGFEAAAEGASVLLAPACASFDMFENYAARGRAFKAEVARLRGEGQGERETGVQTA